MFYELVGRVLGLPPAVADRISVARDLPLRARDGVRLLADHYDPNLPGAPTVLIRTPYGRAGRVGWFCRALAARGFHVLVQSCRGTFGSGGTFEPMRDERADGLDTLDWLGRQGWYSGELCTYGPSYAGFVQWALAAEAGPQLKAMAVSVTASQFRDPTYAGGSFSLDTVLTWSTLTATQEGPRLAGLVELLRGQPRLKRGLAHLPTGAADLVAAGVEVGFYRDWLAHAEPGDPYWDERNHHTRTAEVAAAGVPVLMTAGWYDIFLPWQLDDYAAMRAAGARPYLTVGPWTHGSFGLVRASLGEAVAWFRAHTGAHARGGAGPSALRAQPVRIHVGGADEWRDLPDWPPPGRTTDWYLRAGGGLALEPSTVDDPLGAFTYDPADPTPAVGGPRLVANLAGPRDNAALEERPDVLTYTSGPLSAPVEVVGPVSATIQVRVEGENFDTFVRLCDVTPDGVSTNVCDGLVRSGPSPGGDGIRSVRVPLWPTAYRFDAGHRIRVQVSGGAHPRFARNPGTGAPLGAESELRAVRREILAGSALHLPAG
jgi:putative CocE/NonD family hydrolase